MTKIQNVACLVLVSVLAVHCLGDESAQPASASNESDTTQTGDVKRIAAQARPSIVQITFSGRDGKQQGLGTGFIISTDGLIATNLHVIGEARPIAVELADKRTFAVQSIHASDRGLDLAIVRIDAKNLPALRLGDSDAAQDGEAVIAMGNPHGLTNSVVSGVVSGRREIDGRQMIQLAMPIEPGNSGGPVLDQRGRVLGIVTMKSLITQNLGFAVEVNTLKPLIEKPNPIPLSRWLTIGSLNPKDWAPLFGASWKQRSGRIIASGVGDDPIGRRSICVSSHAVPDVPYEIAVRVRLDDEAGAAGLIFHSDGNEKHYGFYPSNGNLRLSRFEGPSVYTWQVLEEVPSDSYRPGDWNHLKVRVEKDRLLCYVNDDLVIESDDDEFTEGKVGLAKFRDTVAEFKQFNVGKNLPLARPSAEESAQIEKLIAALPPLSELQEGDVARFSENVVVSADVLRERAEQLQRQADELRKFAGDVQMHATVRELGKLMQDDAKDVDLLHAALLIAKLDDAELDVNAYLGQVDRMAAELKDKLMVDGPELSKLITLNNYLFSDNGFHGGRTNYYHRANSYLSSVLDDREGLPITLSVLHMELGRRIGLKIDGVGLPGHFVVRFMPTEGEEQLVDPFDGGKLLTREDADRLVRSFAGRPLHDEDLRASTNREIVLRMLRNLLGVAQAEDDKEAMLRYTEAMLVVEPDLIQERGMRAVLRFQTGRRDAAIADLDWFLDKQPEGIDPDQIRQMREMFRTRKP